ncbi:WD40 repeat protein [Actinoplanes tereljensis]|nr:TIR domain-containing protein [Actinoplanes tereljensis]
MPPWAYHAFISYSHARDLPVAAALQRDLRRFAVPWFRHRTAPLTDRPGPPHRPLRIFRDVTDLSAAPELWPTIEAALASARWFVLIASPGSAASVWVRREIEWWLANRGPDRMLIAVTGGQVVWGDGDFDWAATDALPREPLAGVFEHEPHWIDLRTLREELGDAVADFAAPIRGVAKDTIVGDHLRQRTRARWTLRGAVALLTAAVLATTTAAVIATRQRAIAVDQRNTAVANQLVGESQAVQDSQPGLARQLLAAAYRLKATPQVTGALAAGAAIPQELRVAADRFAFRADGRVLATVGATLRLYDPATLELLAEKPLDGKQVSAAVFGPAPGHLLAVADGTDVLLLDVRDPRAPIEAGRLVGGDELMLAAAFTPDGKRITTADRGGNIQEWNIADPALPVSLGTMPFRKRFARYQLQHQPGGKVAAMAPILLRKPTPPINDELAANISVNPTLLVLLDERDPSRVLPSAVKETDAIYTFAYAPDGRHLVTAGRGAVRLWTASAGGALSAPVTLPVADPAIRVRHIAYGPGGRIAAVGDDGTVSCWDVSGSQPVLTAQFRATPADGKYVLADELPNDGPDEDWSAAEVESPWNPLDLGFSPDGSRFALLTPGGNAEAETVAPPNTLRIYSTLDTRQLGARSVLPGRAVAGPDGTRTVTADEKTIRLWDTTDPLNPRELGSVAAPDTVQGVAFAPDGRSLAAYFEQEVWAFSVDPAGPMREVARWQLVDGQKSCPMPGYEKLGCLIQASAVTFLDRGTVAVGDLTGQVSIFALDHPDGALATVPVTVGSLSHLAPLAAGNSRLLLVAGQGGLVEIWDFTDPAHAGERGRLPGGDSPTWDAAVSPDGRTVAVVRRDGTATVWRVTGGGTNMHRIADLTDTGSLTAVALTPAGDRVAVLGRDRTLAVYRLGDDTATVELLLPVDASAEATASLSFAGGVLSLATAHGTTVVWQLNPAANARALCVGAGPPMTATQWARVAPGLPFHPPCT